MARRPARVAPGARVPGMVLVGAGVGPCGRAEVGVACRERRGPSDPGRAGRSGSAHPLDRNPAVQGSTAALRRAVGCRTRASRGRSEGHETWEQTLWREVRDDVAVGVGGRQRGHTEGRARTVGEGGESYAPKRPGPSPRARSRDVGCSLEGPAQSIDVVEDGLRRVREGRPRSRGDRRPAALRVEAPVEALQAAPRRSGAGPRRAADPPGWPATAPRPGCRWRARRHAQGGPTGAELVRRVDRIAQRTQAAGDGDERRLVRARRSRERRGGRRCRGRRGRRR